MSVGNETGSSKMSAADGDLWGDVDAKRSAKVQLLTENLEGVGLVYDSIIVQL